MTTKFVNLKYVLIIISFMVFLNSHADNLTISEAHSILGLEIGASDTEVKKAYRKMAAKYHPDRSSGSEEKMKRVNQAYDVINNRGSFGDSHSNHSEGGSFRDIYEKYRGGETKYTWNTFNIDGSFEYVKENINLQEFYDSIIKDPHSERAAEAIKILQSLPTHNFNEDQKKQWTQFVKDVMPNIKSATNVSELIVLISGAPYYYTHNPFSGTTYKSIEFTTWYLLDEVADHVIALENATIRLYEILILHGMTLKGLLNHFEKFDLTIQLQHFPFYEFPIKHGLITDLFQVKIYSEALVNHLMFDWSHGFDLIHAHTLNQFLSYYPEKIGEVKVSDMLNFARYWGNRAILNKYFTLRAADISSRDWVEFSYYFGTKQDDFNELKKTSKDRNTTRGLRKEAAEELSLAKKQREMILSHINSFLNSQPTIEQIEIFRLNLSLSKADWFFISNKAKIFPPKPYSDLSFEIKTVQHNSISESSQCLRFYTR